MKCSGHPTQRLLDGRKLPQDIDIAVSLLHRPLPPLTCPSMRRGRLRASVLCSTLITSGCMICGLGFPLYQYPRLHHVSTCSPLPVDCMRAPYAQATRMLPMVTELDVHSQRASSASSLSGFSSDPGEVCVVIWRRGGTRFFRLRQKRPSIKCCTPAPGAQPSAPERTSYGPT